MTPEEVKDRNEQAARGELHIGATLGPGWDNVPSETKPLWDEETYLKFMAKIPELAVGATDPVEYIKRVYPAEYAARGAEFVQEQLQALAEAKEAWDMPEVPDTEKVVGTMGSEEDDARLEKAWEEEELAAAARGA